MADASIDEAALRSPWIFGGTTSLVLAFLAPTLGVGRTGHATTASEGAAIAALVVTALVSVSLAPRVTRRAPHRVVIVRCCIAAVPYLCVLPATRWGAPEWSPGATFLVFIGLLVYSLRSGRTSLAAAEVNPQGDARRPARG